MVFKALVVVVYFICLSNTNQAWLTIHKDHNNWEIELVMRLPAKCNLVYIKVSYPNFLCILLLLSANRHIVVKNQRKT